MQFGLENVPERILNSGKVHRKQHVGNKMDNDEIKELESIKAWNYLGVEESHNVEHKN
jgi:hypothetical protein